MKTIKFRDHLVKLILAGEKDVTWRLFDDKDLQENDIVDLVNWDTGEVFAKAVLVNVREKKLGDINDNDFDGHEKFESTEKMYETYREYYGDNVNPETVVKMIKFEFKR